MASASLDYTVRLWDTATGQPLRTFHGHNNAVVGVAFSPKDDNRLATTGWDGTVRIWDATTGAVVRRLDCGLMLWDVAYSPDGERIAAAGSDGTVRVWDLKTGELGRMDRGACVRPVRGPKSDVQSRRDAARLHRCERQGQPLGRDDRPGHFRLEGPREIW